MIILHSECYKNVGTCLNGCVSFMYIKRMYNWFWITFNKNLEEDDKSSASNDEIIENQSKLDEENLMEGKNWNRFLLKKV